MLLFAAVALSLSGYAQPGQPDAAPRSFKSTAALKQGATTSTWGGGTFNELTHNGKKLLVVFLCHTSGEPTSQPFIFVERSGRWVRLLMGAVAQTEMEATIEADALVLWSLTWPDGQRTRAEVLRYELGALK